MALHLIKLCVGPKSLEELAASVERRAGRGRTVLATTRMTPRRADEVLDGGSLYWVIRGAVACRQRVVDIREARGADGARACDLVLEAELVPVRPRPCRPFQGWRYLAADEAPPDLAARAAVADAPPEMARELMELCLL